MESSDSQSSENSDKQSFESSDRQNMNDKICLWTFIAIISIAAFAGCCIGAAFVIP